MSNKWSNTEYSEEFLIGVDVVDVEIAMNCILRGFIWGDSPQGENKWAKVYDALEAIRDAAQGYQHDSW